MCSPSAQPATPDPRPIQKLGVLRMSDDGKQGSSTGTYINLICEIMRENDRFLQENAHTAYEEVAKLLDDSIDAVSQIARNQDAKEVSTRAMSAFTLHFLMPRSNAVYLALLTGNLPAGFTELRSLLEALAKAYLADNTYPDLSFYRHRIDSLERQNRSISKIMKQMDGLVDTEHRFLGLWRALSQEWIHTGGIVAKIVGHVMTAPDLPSWAFVVPMRYVQSDLPMVEQLGQIVRKYRGLHADVSRVYKMGNGAR